jgi:hypothetical protein
MGSLVPLRWRDIWNFGGGPRQGGRQQVVKVE